MSCVPRTPAETEMRSKSSIVSSTKTGIGLLCAEDGNAAANVARQRLNLFEGHQFDFANARSAWPVS